VNGTYQFLADLLADKRIDETEVPVIREYVFRDGQVNLEDVRLLVELYCEARQRCPEFDDLFFDVLEKAILSDGEIQPAEEFYLLKMLYSDREVHHREREFLMHLRNRAKRTTPEFDALCREALVAPATGWDVGGR
jgi:hypothetical protein